MNLSEIRLEALKDTLRMSKISDQEYFSKKYAAYVSNSRLGNINPANGGSPEKFFNPMGNIYSDSLILGSAVHSIVLQPEFFELVQINRASSKLGFVCDYIWDHSGVKHIINEKLITDASENVGYYKNALTDKRKSDIKSAYEVYRRERLAHKEKAGIEAMFLSPKMYETATKCIEACNNNAEFYRIMHPAFVDQQPISENEQAFLLDIQCNFPDKDPIILRLKAKLDNYTIDFDTNTITVNDLKTIGSTVYNFNEGNNNFERFAYYRELAIYIWLLKMYTEQHYGMKNPRINSNCLVVSTIPEYNTKVYRVTNKDIDKGFKEFRYLLKLVAYYIAYEGYGFK